MIGALKKKLSVDLANNCTIEQGFIESHITGNYYWLNTAKPSRLLLGRRFFSLLVEIVDVAVVIVVEVEALVEAVAFVF